LFGRSVAAAEKGVTAVHESTLVDMYHDGIRGVVFDALVTAERKPEALPDVIKETGEMTAALHKSFEAAAALGVHGEVAQKLEAVRKPLDDYTALAQEIVALAAKDRGAALARLDSFSQQFDNLEGALAAATDALDRAVTAEQEAGSAASRL